MSDRRAQGTINPSRRPDEAPVYEIVNGYRFGRRIFSLRNTASILLTLLILCMVYQELLGLDWREIWTSVRRANVGLFALALAIFYCSFPLRALRWETLLANVSYSRAAHKTMPSVLGLTRIMYLAWFVNCVTVARMGDAYRGYLLKKEAGVSFPVTLGTVLAERLLDLLVMAAMMGVGVLVVFGESLPTEAAQALAAGLILSMVGVIGLLTIRRFRWVFEKTLPKRLHAHYYRLEQGVIGSFGGRLSLLAAYSVVGWVLEGTALYVTAAAVGASVSVAGVLVVALAASLLTVVPITPAGLGFTEAGMLVMLQWLGLDIPTATAITLLFRIINYWSIVVFGFLLYASSRSRGWPTEERWRSMVKAPTPAPQYTLPFREVSVEVVVPVYNEQNALPANIPVLCDYLGSYFPYRWSVVIADNASTDATLAVAQALAAEDPPHVSVLHLEEKGRGRALKAAWLASEADVVAYMDVDLSTNLWSFLPLVAPLATGHSDLAIGSRLLKGATVTRQWKREFISRCYNLLIKLLFGNGFSDAQCGFKALKGSVARSLVAQVEDNEWFFDTELLLLAEERGYRISEVAVDWIEDLDSRVEVVSTALDDVKGLLRIQARRLRRQLSGRWFQVTDTTYRAQPLRGADEPSVETSKSQRSI